MTTALRAQPPATEDDAEVLDVARRADWRFVLPDPSLGRVAYLPPHDAALADALGFVSAGEVTLEASQGSYDTVVLTGGGPGQGRAAGALLRPGGWVYAEIAGRATGAWLRSLRAAGFADVAAHWLWPRADACLEIVPLERQAIRHVLGRRDPGARLRLRARAAGALAGAGLFRFAVRDACVVGRRP
jgi:hypothetical protein